MHKLLIFTFLFFPPIAVAQNIKHPEEATPTSRSQENVADEPEGFDPGGAEIKIITEGDMTFKEYSLNGKVYMVKIQQKGFPPYYLIDRNGDGRMDEQVSELMGPAAPPPNWVLFRW
ncbi:hypothetical protein BMS3Bbin11_01919 [bacterium BMS3Bbin11]|nr:hypothetical protein BMS3Abin11_02253 [bacterium BMS3Abin11]GBE46818.1 hypothetical protein BMS3Bbin11_01919 [bacterium BMS3Bbin11]HDH08004.1 DUF2782 domain-containing protein [Gammaproteobacteria bacterium]HDH16997.1 DUF2782 domain-containing protein [Gammaproteobacteria bacterium]HDZ77905.1 DUF2782 domain-containing protein [Gammaproteobacteria bacterium]